MSYGAQIHSGPRFRYNVFMLRIQYFVYIPSIVGLTIVVLVLLAKNFRKKSILTFALMSATVLIWLICQLVADTTSNTELSLFFLRMGYLFSVFIPFWFLLFCRTFAHEKNRLVDVATLIALAPPIVLSLFSLSEANLSAISLQPWGAQIEKTGPIYTITLVYFIVYILVSLIYLGRQAKKVDPAKHNQIRFIIYGISIAAFLNLFSSYILVLLGLSEYSVLLGTVILPTFLVVVAIAILRHKLFDIRIIVVRSVAFLLSVALLALLYGLLAFQLVSRVLPKDASNLTLQIIYTLLAIVLAFTFQPIRRFFERVSNAVFYRDRYDSQELITKIGRILASEIQLDSLSNKVVSVLKEKIKIDKAEIVVFNHRGVLYRNNAFTYDRHVIVEQDLRKLGNLMVVADDLSGGDRKALMQKYRISVSLALRTSEEFLGYLLLGEKKSGDIYNNEDIRSLKIIANELSVGLQNAKAFAEIQAFNETLQAKVNDATKRLRHANSELKELDEAKDEFISIASHQLRTPLTTVKGYASMISEGDFGKLSAKQKEPVTEILDGSERMNRLVGDLLNVSRIQAGKFYIDTVELDFEQLVAGEVKQLEQLAKSKKVELVYKPPTKKIAPMMLDQNKTEQAVMNLIDNAIHYSASPGGGHVQVSLEVHGNEVVFLVRDDGIGVPRDKQAKLFTKMFRADNAKEVRPDGTGLGLYLVKRVVEDEGGHVVFASEPSKGSTFGFRLPIGGVPKELQQKAKSIAKHVHLSV